MSRSLTARALAPLFAMALALTASVALGADATWTPVAQPAAQPAATLDEVARVEGITAPDAADSAGAPAGPYLGAEPRRPIEPAGAALDVAPTATAAPAPARTAAPTRASTSTSNVVWWSRYHGANHVWMPSLGISKPTYFYSCSDSKYPGNVVYRWGCAGRNNTYLFGHNYGVFYPLYEAWRTGTLRKGMPVVYADAQGRTRLYRVVSWRVVDPTDSAWAMASQSRPSMTLQTCANKAGTNRLVVRLVAVDK